MKYPCSELYPNYILTYMFKRHALFIILALANFYSVWANLTPQYKGFLDFCLNEGGYAYKNEPEQIWRNPAGMRLDPGYKILLSFNRLNEGFYPSFLYAQSPFPALTYALGYYEDKADSLSHRAILGGFSNKLLPGLFLGSTVVTQMLKNEMGLEMHLGLQWEPLSWLRSAASIENLTESPVGDIEADLYMNRKYNLSLSLGANQYINTSMDINFVDDFQNSKVYILGFKFKAGKSDFLNIYSAVKVHQDSLDKANFGFGLSFTSSWKQIHTQVRYGIKGIALSGFESPLYQVFSLTGSLRKLYDIEGPLISVKASNGYLQHTGKLSPSSVNFEINAKDEGSGVESWQLVFCKVNKLTEPTEIIRSYTGRGLPPQFIRWDGRSGAGELLAEGLYAYRFLSQDKKGNQTFTRWQLVEIRP